MAGLRARPLTQAEERHFLKNEGKAIRFSGPLSIMGPSDHSFVESTIHSDTTRSMKVDLGYGQYIYETVGCGKAEGGTTIPIEWGIDSAVYYVLFVAKELGIPYFVSSEYKGLVYFQRKYEKLIINCVSYVDRKLSSYEKQRSIFSRWFGPICITDWNSAQGATIRAEVRRMLTKLG